jgi:hypothetical protein
MRLDSLCVAYETHNEMHMTFDETAENDLLFGEASKGHKLSKED